MQLFLIFVFLFMTFLFTSSEMAFIASNRFLVIIRAKKSKAYKILFNLLQKPEKFLYTILIGTNLSIVILSTITEKVFFANRNIENSLIFSLVLSLIILIIAEIIPKTLTKGHAEELASFYAIFIEILFIIFYPFIILSQLFSHIFIRFFGIDAGKRIIPKLSKGDFHYFIKDEVNYANRHENKIIEGIFNFNERTAKDIMIPRIDIVSIDINSNFEEIKKELLENEKIFTRLPVFRKNEDNIVGILNINDMLINKSIAIEKIMDKDVLYAPENASLEKLLSDMKKNNKHMGIIVNEYGGLSGILTIEDIIEEFLGEIEDEYDSEETIEDKNGKIIVNGDATIEDIRERYGIKLPDRQYYETIAGFIFYKVGKIPTEGLEIKYKNYNIKVLYMVENIIKKVEIERR